MSKIIKADQVTVTEDKALKPNEEKNIKTNKNHKDDEETEQEEKTLSPKPNKTPPDLYLCPSTQPPLLYSHKSDHFWAFHFFSHLLLTFFLVSFFKCL